MKKDWYALEGSPSPQGATWIEEEKAFNFALYSENATGVTLLLYHESDPARPVREYRYDYLKNRSGRMWHCRVPLSETGGAKYYAYRVEGPFQPEKGHRFDPEKILLDPYAKAVYFPPAFSRAAAEQPGSNAGKAPLGVLRMHEKPFDWGERATKPWHSSDKVIYELHVRGFTMRENSGVTPAKRGTYLGLTEKIPYLKELGVTSVELQPVFQSDPQEGSFWGYMPLNFFSPHDGYASGGEQCDQINEFRAMVKAFHEADMEVILDVVYNHTTEGDETGPTYCFRGIDNDQYYLLEQDRRFYRNDTGVGNVLHCGHPYIRKVITDSLSFWAREMGVDGFRFDLASIFTRDMAGRINLEDPPIVTEIRVHPDLVNTELIAEAWDLSAYQLGVSFPGLFWRQWNGQFRDDVRSFVRGDPGKVATLMTRLYGSNDLFPDHLENVFRPYQSVNFVTAHDGFCLYDLVSYEKKRNEANGHHNTDGTDMNLSWNCGWEGDEGAPPGVLDLRRKQVKNFCTLLFLSNGTPMMRAGDEFMNTQKGNNNPYNQDNEITWLDWNLLDRNRDIFRFFKLMIAFRKDHHSLGRGRFWREDVRWYGTGREVDMGYDSRHLAFFLSGAREEDDDIYVMINAHAEDLVFTIQEGEGREWLRVVDTGEPSPGDICEPGTEAPLTGRDYRVKGRSVVVLRRPLSGTGPVTG